VSSAITCGVHQQIESAQQELDETDYWLELLFRSGTVNEQSSVDLRREVAELLAIFTSSARTAKRNKNP